jgi:hypothetical protein
MSVKGRGLKKQPWSREAVSRVKKCMPLSRERCSVFASSAEHSATDSLSCTFKMLEQLILGKSFRRNVSVLSEAKNQLSLTGWAEATELGPGQIMAWSRPGCHGEIQDSTEYLRPQTAHDRTMTARNSRPEVEDCPSVAPGPLTTSS